MRAAGYTRVSVQVERTIDEALRRAARWTVRRDGEEARARDEPAPSPSDPTER
jgi:hypothetical protein